MKLEKYVNTEMRFLINENLKNSVLVFALNAWFQLRVAFMNIGIIQLPAFVFLAFSVLEGVDTTYVAMMLIYATMISNDAIKTLQMISDLETILISVEFCVDFEKIEHEDMYTQFKVEEESMVDLGQDFSLKASSKATSVKQIRHIKEGKVGFLGVSARYPSKSKNVISN